MAKLTANKTALEPKKLLHSKWSKVQVTNKEKHFVISKVEFDEQQRVTFCLIEAVINKREYAIDWHELTNPNIWQQGWR